MCLHDVAHTNRHRSSFLRLYRVKCIVSISFDSVAVFGGCREFWVKNRRRDWQGAHIDKWFYPLGKRPLVSILNSCKSSWLKRNGQKTLWRYSMLIHSYSHQIWKTALQLEPKKLLSLIRNLWCSWSSLYCCTLTRVQRFQSCRAAPLRDQGNKSIWLLPLRPIGICSVFPSHLLPPYFDTRRRSTVTSKTLFVVDHSDFCFIEYLTRLRGVRHSVFQAFPLPRSSALYPAPFYRGRRPAQPLKTMLQT